MSRDVWVQDVEVQGTIRWLADQSIEDYRQLPEQFFQALYQDHPPQKILERLAR